MCEETDREGRGLENKWIYVPLLFVFLSGQCTVLLRSDFFFYLIFLI